MESTLCITNHGSLPMLVLHGVKQHALRKNSCYAAKSTAVKIVIEVSGACTKFLHFSVKGRKFQLKQFSLPFIIVSLLKEYCSWREKKVCYNYSSLEHKYYSFIISFESCKRIVPHQITSNGLIFHEHGDDAPGDKMVISLCEMTHTMMVQ